MRFFLAPFCGALLMAAPALGATPPDDYCAWWGSTPKSPGDKAMFVCIQSSSRVLLRMPPGAMDPDAPAKAAAGDARAMLLLGHDALYRGDGAAGLDWIRKAADAKEPDAMAELAQLYRRGVLVEVDAAKALSLYRDAAALGSAAAMNDLGGLYAEGGAVAKDDAAASDWFHKAAESGHVGAMFVTGARYEAGIGGPKDFALAMRWLKQAFDAGQRAQPAAMIAKMYDLGEGVPADPSQAFNWYRISAQNGYPEAMRMLAQMYRDGRGVEKDLGQAQYWYGQAQQRAPH